MDENDSIPTSDLKPIKFDQLAIFSSKVNAKYPVDKRPQGGTAYSSPGSTGMPGRLDGKASSLTLRLGFLRRMPFGPKYQNIVHENGYTKIELAYSDISHVSVSWTGMIQLHVKEPQKIAGFAFNCREINQVVDQLRLKNVPIDQDVASNGMVVSRTYLYDRILGVVLATLMFGFLGFTVLLFATNGKI